MEPCLEYWDSGWKTLCSSHLIWLLTHQPLDMLRANLLSSLQDATFSFFPCPSVQILTLSLICHSCPLSESQITAATSDHGCHLHLIDLSVHPGGGQLLTWDRCGSFEGCAHLMRICIPGTPFIYFSPVNVMSCSISNQFLIFIKTSAIFYFFSVPHAVWIMVSSCYWLVKDCVIREFSFLFGDPTSCWMTCVPAARSKIYW